VKNVYLWKFDVYCITDCETFPIRYYDEPPFEIRVIKSYGNTFTTSFFNILKGVLMEGLPVYKQVDIKIN